MFVICFLLLVLLSITITRFLIVDKSQVPGNPGFTDYDDLFPSNKHKGDMNK